MSKQRFSLSRFFESVLERGTPTNYELDVSNELGRSLSPHWKTKRGEVAGYLVPSNAFDSAVLTRDVTVGGSGSALIGQKVRQLFGVSVGARLLTLEPKSSDRFANLT